MVRDKNCDEDYFLKVLIKEKKVIDAFEEKVFNLDASNIYGLTRGKTILFRVYWDTCIISYSLGRDVETINIWLTKCINLIIHEGVQKEAISNAYLYDLVSLTYLIGTTEQLKTLKNYIQKISLSDAFFDLIFDKKMSRGNVSQIQVLNEIIKNCDGDYVETICEYMKNKWYNDQSEKWWFDSLGKSNYCYIGYWAIEVAAIVKFLELPVEYFATIDHFPKDLLMYKEDTL